MARDEVEILLVEDDPGDVELTLHALQSERLANRIQVVRDGEEALDFIFCRGVFSDRDPDSWPRLILLDLKLPKLDGIEVLRQIKSNPGSKALPVVILASSRQEKDVLNGYLLGANSYIQKPVDFEQFRRIVRQLGLYWLLVNQPPPPQVFSNS
jgi:two-component system response regulator